MKLTINLATRRYINLTQLNLSLALALVLLAGFGLYKAREVGENRAELAQIRHLSSAVTGKGGRQVSEAELKALNAQIKEGNIAIDRKSLDWIGLLDRLEGVVPNGVALTSIEPSQRDGAVHISGAARAFGNLRSLMENMERSPDFSEVYLLSQSETKVGLTQTGTVFSISCKVNLP